MNLVNLNNLNSTNILDANIIDELKEYMLTESKIKQSIQFNNIPNIIKKEQKNNIKSINDIFFPYEKDKLFWCFYIMKNGILNYEMLENKNIITEKKIKIEYIEKIRKEKQLIKKYKFASLTHIENTLLNENIIDLKTFLSLCIIENLNIFYIYKKTYFELLLDDATNEDDTNINDFFIIHLINNKFGYKINKMSDIINYRKTLFKIENIEKPIKGIAIYKIQELVDFCIKLDIEVINKSTNKHKNKKDLYDEIIQYFKKNE